MAAAFVFVVAGWRALWLLQLQCRTAGDWATTHAAAVETAHVAELRSLVVVKYICMM
jgi:hypothetical protein